MGELFGNFSEWMMTLPALWAYAAILAIAFGENVVPPIPGDLVVVFGGYLVGIGKLEFVPVILLATLGGAAGFMTMYAIGFRVGNAVLDPGRLRWLPKEQIFKVQKWLERWGYWVVALNRFLSGARSVISLTVGMAHTNPAKTAAFATLSAFVWTSLITYAGFAVGDNWRVIGEWLSAYGRVMLLLLGVGAVGWLVYAYMRKRNSR